jgi:hypothetical protein
VSDYDKSIGTKSNPLELNYLMPERNLFKKIITEYKGDPLVGFVIKDAHRPKTFIDYFHINLVSNPILTLTDVAIATFLHLTLWEEAKNVGGKIFWTSESDQSEFELGDKSKFYYSYDGSIYEHPTPLKSLKAALIKHGINTTNETMIKSLRKLHGCHYITVTTKHGRKSEGDDPKVRSELRHITIYPSMVYKKMYLYWKDKKNIDFDTLYQVQNN